jgi:hypothetical protein
MHGLEPSDQLTELTGNYARLRDRGPNAVGISSRPATASGDLALNEMPKRDARGGESERGREGGLLVATAVVAEDELVQVGPEMLAGRPGDHRGWSLFGIVHAVSWQQIRAGVPASWSSRGTGLFDDHRILTDSAPRASAPPTALVAFPAWARDVSPATGESDHALSEPVPALAGFDAQNVVSVIVTATLIAVVGGGDRDQGDRPS